MPRPHWPSVAVIAFAMFVFICYFYGIAQLGNP